MVQRAYFVVCGTVFLAVAAIHLSRLIWGWDAFFGGWRVPHWISVPGFLVSGLLSAWGFALASRTPDSGTRP